MIKGILIVNNHGKPRIVKFYEHVVRQVVYALVLCKWRVVCVCGAGRLT